MRLPMPPKPCRRSAFTLIELLVVIAIIGILMALTIAGVMKFLAKGPEAQNVSDISQLSAALDAFKVDFKSHPPSLIRLRSNSGAYNPSDALDRHSLAALSQLWGRFPINNVDWGGGINNSGFVLEGDQCLVFFLGGKGGTSGLSKTNNNPFGPSPKRYFEFKSHRLYSRNNSPFPSYKDAYGNQPFVYFSSGKVDNGYNQPISHAITGLNGVQPYYEAAGRYHRPSGFQIISAGENGLFYGGGVWTPANASAVGNNGQDDQTNFHTARMGINGN